MDFGRSFSYQFDDPQWISKLGIAALISFVPILNLAMVGYMVGIIRNVTRGEVEPLPNWDDLGSKFMDGLIVTAAALVYAAPLLIVVCLPLGFFAASGIISQNSDLQDLAQSLAGAGGVVFACLLSLFLLYALGLSIIRPIILVIFSRDGTFASCFRFREISRILSRYAGLFFSTWIVVVIAGLAVGLGVGLVNLLVGWIPCVGWAAGGLLALATAVYLVTIDAHLFGQFRVVALGAKNPRSPVSVP